MSEPARIAKHVVVLAALRRSGLVLVALAALVGRVEAQEAVFHSTQSANLQTATTIRGGLWMFEISHRFLPAIAEGSDALWGLDGPVNNRLGLAWAPTGWMMIGLLRSNLDDNLEPNLKVRFGGGSVGPVRFQVGAMGGIAFNIGAPEGDGVEGNESQFYGQLMVDLGLGDFALGIVPTGFHNPRIEDVEPVSTFALGLHGQYYVARGFSVLAEWVMSVESVAYPYDGVSAGIEFETRGHFFKLLVTNQVRMNPTQYLVGTPFDYRADALRLGFNITRVLSF
jgi:hypothetical protein